MFIGEILCLLFYVIYNVCMKGDKYHKRGSQGGALLLLALPATAASAACRRCYTAAAAADEHWPQGSSSSWRCRPRAT